MTQREVRDAIDAALGSVAFEPPVSIEYCVDVRAALRTNLPAAAIDVFHRKQLELVVHVRVDGVECTVTLPLV